jgi:hypothetical protein
MVSKHVVMAAQVVHLHPRKQRITVSKEAIRDKHVSLIRQFFPDAARVLCVGCRHQSEPDTFIRSGYAATGMDINGGPGIIRMDAAELSDHFESEAFDVCYACHSLEHQHAIRAVLEGIRSVCRMGLMAILPGHHIAMPVTPNHPTIFDVMSDPPDDLQAAISRVSDFEQSLSPCRLVHYEKVPDKGPYCECSLIFDWRV